MLGLGVSGPAGRRGLVRRAVRQAAGPHARVRVDRARRHRPARARHLGGAPLPAPRVSGARGSRASASHSSRSCTRCASGFRSTSPRRARRTSRWPPRSGTAGCRCTTPRTTTPSCTARCLEEGFARRGGAPEDFEIAPSVPLIVRRRHRAGRGRAAPDVRPVLRRDGGTKHELPSPGDRADGLRGRGQEDPGSLPRTGRRTRLPPRCRRSCRGARADRAGRQDPPRPRGLARIACDHDPDRRSGRRGCGRPRSSCSARTIMQDDPAPRLDQLHSPAFG